MAAMRTYDGGCAADWPDAIVEADAGALTGLV
jgi:hypothetical protein